MGLVIGTPTVEPISTDEAKEQLRITNNDEDALINRMITAARIYVEGFTSRSTVNRTNVWTLDKFPAETILYVPRPPFSSTTTLKYTDSDGTQQTWAAANYTDDTASTPGRISTAYNVEWPTTRDVIDAVEVTYVAGYGATGSTVDEILRTCIAMYVVEMFEHRGAQSEMRIVPNEAIDSLMRMKMVPEIR
jgi:uncharacterized phiE125 gp8 family phage protein